MSDHLWFRPLKWRCRSSLKRQQLQAYRQIEGSGEWGAAPNIRVNDKFLLGTLPLTFTFRIGAEGTDRFFGALVYFSPREEFPVHSAEVHIELNMTVQDFDDLWVRSGGRIPQQIYFDVEGLPDDGLIWDNFDYTKDPNSFFIVSYGFENIALPRQQPVRLPEKNDQRRPTTGISVAVSSVYIDYSMPSGYLSRLTCEGFISPRGSKQDHLKGSECSIEFTEYRKDLEFTEYREDKVGPYPKESLSGTFGWDKRSRSFSVELRYRDLDLIGPLGPLISFGTSDWVHIRMTLVGDIAEQGEISHWSVLGSQTKRAKLEYKINVLGEVAIEIYATVFTSSVWLFLYIIGLKGYAIVAAIVLAPFASMIIYSKLKQILNNDPRSSS